MFTRWQNPLIYSLAFSSGFTIMGIELLGGRILAPFFGSSIHIWGSIITVFMVSLSFGYLLGGKLSTSNASLKRFGIIYLLGGIFILPIALYANEIMQAIFLQIEDSRYGSLSAATALFFLPTVILGMLSPYSVRLLVKNKNESGQVAGVLYFVSTLGSALGTIITSFYLVLYMEVNQIIFTFSGFLLLLGLIAIAADKITKNTAAHVKEQEVRHV
ncbi:fused MFS/spermidine synthase [Thalassomonas haliotis]|uniref:Fused MFS/spermidine synthase n=1 Tax=Thalassomonas haliotis TaxID=485448 RepID=A0ABY7VCQ7_9GAMM|nr:fused MFS/spermidine synthase [Thalassomonas haliotis]WDE11450.1 fused MFS/spermidine synthase [Thalassomonas haliotis]